MTEIAAGLLMYGVLPLWLAAGLADWHCHRASAIERTSGTKEALLHVLQFVEVGVGLITMLFLEVTSGLFAVLILCSVLHEVTAIWDVGYANATRRVAPAEQHVHAVLESLPFAAVAVLTVAHWPAFVGLAHPANWLDLRGKAEPLPTAYLIAVFTGAGLFGILPYGEELYRTIREKRARVTNVTGP